MEKHNAKQRRFLAELDELFNPAPELQKIMNEIEKTFLLLDSIKATYTNHFNQITKMLDDDTK